MKDSDGLIGVCVEAYAYECAVCGERSTPAMDEIGARAYALEDGKFKDGVWYCNECAALQAINDDVCASMNEMEMWECPECGWKYAPCGPLSLNGEPEVKTIHFEGLVPGMEVVREVHYCPACGRALREDKDKNVVPVPESKSVWQKRLAAWVASIGESVR